MTPTFDELAARFQSRRVARDVLDFGRNVNAEHWWWWDATLGLERLEQERAKEKTQAICIACNGPIKDRSTYIPSQEGPLHPSCWERRRGITRT